MTGQSSYLLRLPEPNGHLNASDSIRENSELPDENELIHRAVWDLAISKPEFSAAFTLCPWQRIALFLSFIGLAIACYAEPTLTATIILAMLVVPFLCVVALRTLALWHFLSKKPADKTSDTSNERQQHYTDVLARALESQTGIVIDFRKQEDLPTYAVLIPLLKEDRVVAHLVRALEKLDYPRRKLEISLIVEAFDTETRDALYAADLPPHMRIVIVPDGHLRTKPRALNYALQTARGEYVVVFDAEDVPDPDQLRRAAQLLKAGNGKVGCVQACLNIYNPNASWFTRQFTIEYTALFDALLPALKWMEWPIPLGGTSNHFSRRALEDVGAWDPFNVTEDADLGFRLVRKGWHVDVLRSTTWEEAPQTFPVWFKQRTRWLKGWMQTFAVHLRQPMRLTRELGVCKTIGLQILLGGLLLSALVHPWFYIFLACEALGFSMLPTAMEGSKGLYVNAITRWFFLLGLINLAVGYIVAIAIGSAAVSRRGRKELILSSLMMPLYWLLISLAAYRALWQLVTTPHSWEKTEHGAARPPGY